MSQCSSKRSHRSRNLCAILEISMDMKREELEETFMKTILCLLKEISRNDTK